MNYEKVGTRIAELVTNSYVKARQGLLKHEHAMHTNRVNNQMETWERELAPLVQKMYGDLLDNEDMPDAFKEMLRPASGPEHPVDFIILLFGLLGIAFTVPGAAASNFAQSAKNASFDMDPTVPIDPGLAATILARRIAVPVDAAHEARKGGVDSLRLDSMVKASYRPPDVGAVLDSYRRGFIGYDTMISGLQYLGYRDDWVTNLAKMAYGPPSPQWAAEAAVEGHITRDQQRTITGQGGIDPAYADAIYETQGNPPGAHEMLDLWNRGLIDEPTLDQAILESRLKPKYTQVFKGLAEHIPPMRTALSMVHTGVISGPDGIGMLRKLGFSEVNAERMVAAALSAKTAKAKELSQGQVVTLYERHALDRSAASDRLTTLGYDATEVGLLLDQADARRTDAIRQAAVGKIGNRYIARHLDRVTASSQLDRLTIPATERDLYLTLWDIERDSVVATLTAAQLIAATKKGAMDPTIALARIVALGYTEDDARLLAASHDVAL